MTAQPNPDRPLPQANTGSALLNWLSDASIAFIHLERRFDPFFRPAFDALLRDPIARLSTALINRKRSNDGLKIAEEKLLPDEEAYLDSIINSFEKQMRLLWKPGMFERGGNTKTTDRSDFGEGDRTLALEICTLKRHEYHFLWCRRRPRRSRSRWCRESRACRASVPMRRRCSG